MSSLVEKQNPRHEDVKQKISNHPNSFLFLNQNLDKILVKRNEFIITRKLIHKLTNEFLVHVKLRILRN